MPPSIQFFSNTPPQTFYEFEYSLRSHDCSHGHYLHINFPSGSQNQNSKYDICQHHISEQIIVMWKKIVQLYKRVPQNFYNLNPSALPGSLYNALSNKIYYTPKLQKFAFTEELDKYIRFLNRKDKLKVNDMRSLTEAILTQYGVIHGLQNHPSFQSALNFSITRNYQFFPNELSPFHGKVDYMVWLNDKHFVPVIFFEDKLNIVAGMALAHAVKGLKCIARNNYKNSGYSIITTGQEWQMFKVYSNENSEKTVVYEGRNRFKNIIEDVEMIQTILGLIDQCLETERQDVNVLKLAYDIIDQKRYMIEAPSKEEALKSSPISKLLLKYYKKKQDQTSK